MKKLIKHKYFKRLLNLSKFKRHKRVRFNLVFLKKRLDFFSSAYLNTRKQEYILKGNRVKYFKETEEKGNKSPAKSIKAKNVGKKDDAILWKHDENETKNHIGDPRKTILKKKKYKIKSYLSQVLLRLPRKYDFHFLGKEVFRRYYTSPLKLSAARFTADKILRGYYKNLSRKALLNIRKNIKHPNLHFYHQKKDIEARKFNKLGDKKELAKNFALNLERRLDSTILRILNFRSAYGCRFNNNRTENRSHKKYKTTSLWTTYSASQVKQWIAHEKISVNGNKVKSRNIALGILDKVGINGFIPKITKAKQKNIVEKKYESNTILIRRLKTRQNNDDANLDAEHTSVEGDKMSAHREALYNYIKDLKIKRFTESFYLTYRNLHLIKRNIVSNENAPLIEHEILPIFEGIGNNQSIFALWPISRLLKVTQWTPKLKERFIKLKWHSPLGRTKSVNKKTKQEFYKFLREKRITNVNTENTNPVENSRPTNIVKLVNIHAQRDVAASKYYRSYAAIAYGTKVCKWVKLQQGSKQRFYNKIYKKNEFFEVELEFFQLAYQQYNG